MCGRFALFCSKETLIDHYSIKTSFFMAPRYNIAPSQVSPIVTSDGMVFSRWGFVPHWNESLSAIPKGYINARLEGVSSKPSFKAAFKTHRCLVPASGYFEWKVIKGIKQPFFIHTQDASILSFAGLHSHWRDSAGELHSTFAILTGPAHPALQAMHERMPLCLSVDHYDDWLFGTSASLSEDAIPSLLLQDEWVYFPVTRKVNNPQNDDVSCILHL